jgi:hypothetical protein
LRQATSAIPMRSHASCHLASRARPGSVSSSTTLSAIFGNAVGSSWGRRGFFHQPRQRFLLGHGNHEAHAAPQQGWCPDPHCLLGWALYFAGEWCSLRGCQACGDCLALCHPPAGIYEWYLLNSRSSAEVATPILNIRPRCCRRLSATSCWSPPTSVNSSCSSQPAPPMGVSARQSSAQPITACSPGKRLLSGLAKPQGECQTRFLHGEHRCIDMKKSW